MDRGNAENDRIEPRADRWTRNSFTMRRMTWTNIWAILGGLAVAVVIVAVWMN